MVWFNMCNMKNLFCVLLVGILCVMPAMAVPSYKSQVADCDSKAEKDLNNPKNYSNVRMVQITDTQTECYKSIALDIIQKYYAQNAKNMISEFKDFCDTAQRLSYTTEYPDSCAPQCGTFVGLQSAVLYQKMVLNYITSLIEVAEAVPY